MRRREAVAFALAAAVLVPASCSRSEPVVGRPAVTEVARPSAYVPAAHPSVYRTATGNVASYDARGRVLTLRAATGLSAFRVAEDARAWLGSRRLPTARLADHVGAEATVAFTDAGEGLPTTHTVRLIEGAASGAPR